MKNGFGRFVVQPLRNASLLLVFLFWVSPVLYALPDSAGVRKDANPKLDAVREWVSYQAGVPPSFLWIKDSRSIPPGTVGELKRLPGIHFVDHFNSGDEEVAFYPVDPEELHLVDINRDGHMDVIYQAFLGMSRGYQSKIIMGSSSGWGRPASIHGQVLSFDKSRILVHRAPCCDGFLHQFIVYSLEQDSFRPDSTFILFQSNLDRLSNVAVVKKQTTEQPVPAGTILYYLASRPIYKQRNEAPIIQDREGMYPFAQVKKEAKVIVFDTTKTVGGSQFQLVLIDVTFIESFQQVQNVQSITGSLSASIFAWMPVGSE